MIAWFSGVSTIGGYDLRIDINRLESFLNTAGVEWGSKGPEVQILSPRPKKTKGYGIAIALFSW
jgi:hypothetical protein